MMLNLPSDPRPNIKAGYPSHLMVTVFGFLTVATMASTARLAPPGPSKNIKSSG